MTPRMTRILLRIAHILLGVCVAVVVYVPAAWTEPLRLALGAVAVPVVVLTGLVMWQQGRLSRLLTRRRGHEFSDHTGSRA